MQTLSSATLQPIMLVMAECRPSEPETMAEITLDLDPVADSPLSSMYMSRSVRGARGMESNASKPNTLM